MNPQTLGLGGGPNPFSAGPPPKEILIVMMSAIGDAVHVLPMVTALKRAWPESRITWVVQPVPHLLAQGHPDVDEFIVFNRRRGASAWRSYLEIQQGFAAARVLRERRFGSDEIARVPSEGFVDADVKPGHRYRYQVILVREDSSEAPPSLVIEATVPE